MKASAAEDLTHEFEALKLLHCNAIAGASEMFQDESMYYMVCEMYYGGDFETLKPRALEQGVTLTENWWRSVFCQVLEGLAFMHEQATIHCDIKEQNLMVKTTDLAQPQVVIIDLGVAVSMAAEDDGHPAGTPGYVPPETLETLMWFPRGDLFSMGVVILQMMIDKVSTGNYEGIFQEGCRSVQEIFAATRSRQAPTHLLPPEMPLLMQLTEQLLQKKRKDRPTAAQALKHTWFQGYGEGASDESWALSDACRRLRPKSRFATQGITKAFLDGMADSPKPEDEAALDV